MNNFGASYEKILETLQTIEEKSNFRRRALFSHVDAFRKRMTENISLAPDYLMGAARE
ncbi:MAG: hypothetical protein LBR65_05585 [Culturomica sp.]|jgi:hypothetical protein|nr:hypothetical protein [Culturomica sp.]